jgi:hypothetical protein
VSSPRRHAVLALAGAAILSTAALLWLFEPARERVSEARGASPPLFDARPAARPERKVSGATQVARFDEQRRPHPITAQHVRNFRQVDLLDGAWGALQHHDFARARELVAKHRRDYPGQWEDMNEGLEILAECLERPSPEILERAARFHRERTASMMRKRIRRYCLER